MKTEKEKAAGLQMITVDQTTFPVEVRNGRLAINLTVMGKKYGKQKQPSNWLRTDEARRYLDALSKLQKCGLADLVEVRNGGIPGLNGTWCYDRRIAVRYAQFLDEILAIKVDTLLIDMLEGRKYVANAKIFEGEQYVSQADFCRIYQVSSHSFFAYKGHFNHEFLHWKGTWFVSTAVCRRLEYLREANYERESMICRAENIKKLQLELPFSMED